MANGDVKPLASVQAGDTVWAYGELGGGMTKTTVRRLIPSAVKPLVRITTSNRALDASTDHPVLAVQSIKDYSGRWRHVAVWRALGDLRVGDKVAILRQLPDRTRCAGLRINDASDQTKDLQGDRSLLPSDVCFQTITSMGPLAPEQTYDLELDSHHAFFADGVLVHNSGGAVYVERDGHYYFCGVPSRVAGSWGQAITHMGWFVPIPRIREWLKDEELRFILDAKVKPADSFKAREEKKRESERKRLLERVAPQSAKTVSEAESYNHAPQP
jgi:hypothetical protein